MPGTKGALMAKYAFALMLAGAAGFGAARAQDEKTCLHGTRETTDQRARRVAALEFARQLNTFEAAGKNQAQSYYAIADLPGLPPMPEGFRARMSTDGASYAFSVKDTLDACHFALFSDQDGVIYAGMPIRRADHQE
jgi:hypothetical protein